MELTPQLVILLSKQWNNIGKLVIMSPNIFSIMILLMQRRRQKTGGFSHQMNAEKRRFF